MQASSQQSDPIQNILVLGAGNFGTCLAQHLAHQGHKICLWSNSTEQAALINKDHRNPWYLNQIRLSDNITATSDLASAFTKDPTVVVVAIPAQALREVFSLLQPLLKTHPLLVCAAKGIEAGTGLLPSQIAGEILGDMIATRMVSLSGPSFAQEVAEQQPTGVSVASRSPERAVLAQQVFHSPRFRAYTSDDPTGLEIAGAMKNVIAIASGACAGLGFQANSRATLITRGLAEMTRVGVALGARAITFKGLGGVGDLFLTCSSEKSRNFTVGYQLGQGKLLEDILRNLGSTAEGVTTCQPAHNLAKKLGVIAPVTEAVYQVLCENIKILDVVEQLMNRDAKPEFSLD